jgi:hypothetical protein
MNFIEKRKMERFALNLPALLSMNDGSGNPKVTEFMISNICSGGAFFKTDEPLSVDTDVKMDLILPLEKFNPGKGNRSRIHVSGSVIRTTDQGMAVCFDRKYRIEPY